LSRSDADVRSEFFGHKKSGKFAAGDTRGWKLDKARRKISNRRLDSEIQSIAYRPFDTRAIYYNPDMVDWGRDAFYERHPPGQNLYFVTVSKQLESKPVGYYFCTDLMAVNGYIRSDSVSIDSIFPLYEDVTSSLSGTQRVTFDPKLYSAICKEAGIDAAERSEREDNFRAATGEARPSEVKVFDYIYGVLHSPTYRETFAEFLKTDFPRIPYPPSPEVFRNVSEKGEQLRRLHLMEPGAVGEANYPYRGDGDDAVASGYPKWESGCVYISKDQYFENVPKLAWEFYIGGYQPAQKWLKDRRGRLLSFEDITQYQRIVKILVQTDRIMKEIELPLS
jgi:predicted helicase